MNESKPIEQADQLLRKMTLEEKVSQLVHDAKAIERLGIKKYNWWNECLHGVARAGTATVFPQTIGIAATWNLNLVHEIATAISDEARAKHHEFDRAGKHEIYQGLTYWSPNINIFRDPRWGRGMETFGEDPVLTSVLAVAFIKGLQGDDPNYLKLVATPKHFAVHSGPENQRHTFDAKPSTRDLSETYLPAFEACITEGKAYSIMGAYNRIFGEACTASSLLLKDILRKKWGFKGYVVSDAGAITDISEHHKIVGSLAEAAALAVKNGTDLCAGTEYLHLLEAVHKGFIQETEIDTSLRRLLTAKAKLGMFDAPEKVPYSSIPYNVVDCEKHKALALQTAMESLVLLKNQNQLLPLSKNLKTIAVIGPNGNDRDIHLGNYHGTPSSITSLFEGIKRKVGDKTKVVFERGCELATGLPFLEILSKDYIFSEESKTKSGLQLKYFNNNNFEGSPAQSVIIEELNSKIFDCLANIVNDISDFSILISGYLIPKITGQYALGIAGLTSFQLFVDGNLLAEFDTIWEPEKVYELLDLEADQTYFIELKIKATTSEAHVQKLLWAVPDENREQKALSVAQSADVIILAMGLSPQLEGEEMPVIVPGFNQGDRSDINLPATQENFIQKIAALGKPTILISFSGCALALNWANENIPAIVQAWYGGQAAGDAVANMLFGDFNPSGRLPVTFYKSINQLPAFDDYSMDGRTYKYFKDEPLFPFGFGLSYSEFKYSNLQITKNNLDFICTVSVDIENISDIDGVEVAQLYTKRINTSEKYPIRSLQSFTKIHLKSGEKRNIQFNLSEKNFSIIQKDLQRKVEPGFFEILVGGRQPTFKLADGDYIVKSHIEL